MLSFRARIRMDAPSRQPGAAAVELAAAITRLAADLALAEEPSGFVAALENDHLQALRLRTCYAREFVARVFGEVDALGAPVIPEPAPALDAVKAGSADDVVRRMGRFSRLTRPFDEATTLRLGHAHERAAGWVARRPALA